MELKENERLVHIFKYGKKEIPVYYDVEKVKDKIEYANTFVENMLLFFKENSLSDTEQKLLFAEESISTSYIEGYENYLPHEKIIEKDGLKSLEEKAVYSGYVAYTSLYSNKLFNKLDKDELLKIWRPLVSYKKFFIKNYRKTGVRVGRGLKTTHFAPSAKYIQNLLDDMFYTLGSYNEEVFDNYGLIKPILFHYLFTFIHPFIDGNGRTARLVEEYLLSENIGIPYCLPLSSMILQNKKDYYNAFKVVKNIDNNHLDILSIDLTEFLLYNISIIVQAASFLLSESQEKGNGYLFYKIFEDYKNKNLENRIEVMLKYIRGLSQGITKNGYKTLWNSITPNGVKITIEDAESDLNYLLSEGLIIKDERYTLYPGFKYYNK